MTDFKKLVTVISVILIAAIIVGEVFIYTFDAKSTYGSSATIYGDGISCTVNSNIASTYSVIILDNGETAASSEYYLFYDPKYPTVLAEDSEYDDCIEQLKYQLKKNDISPKTLDAKELSVSMDSDLTKNTCSKALIILSGAFPDTVYSGNSDDLIFRWMSNGGKVYWSGNIIGSYYSTEKETKTVENGQRLFFGNDCSNTSGVSKTTEEIKDNDFGKMLCLQNNDVLYGIDTDKIQNRKCLQIGFEKDGYASTSIVEYGKGMICVFGGELSTKMRTDMTQTISSGICWSSELLKYENGELVRTSHTTYAEFTPKDHYYSAYTFIGGYFTEYGARYDFRNTSPL